MTLTIHQPELFVTRPAVVLFDTDNTLYEYEPAHTAALGATRDKAKRMLNLSAETFDEAYGEARQMVKQRLEGTASSHSRLLYFQRMLEILGLRTQMLLALDFEQTYWRTFLGQARLFPAVKRPYVQCGHLPDRFGWFGAGDSDLWRIGGSVARGGRHV